MIAYMSTHVLVCALTCTHTTITNNTHNNRVLFGQEPRYNIDRKLRIMKARYAFLKGNDGSKF